MLKVTKGHELLLLIVCVVFFQMITNTEAGVRRKINCRKYVHAPECRGIAAKRDTGRFFDDDLNMPPNHHGLVLEFDKFNNDNDKIANEKASLLDELLRKLVDDYEN